MEARQSHRLKIDDYGDMSTNVLWMHMDQVDILGDSQGKNDALLQYTGRHQLRRIHIVGAPIGATHLHAYLSKQS